MGVVRHVDAGYEEAIEFAKVKQCESADDEIGNFVLRTM